MPLSVAVVAAVLAVVLSILLVFNLKRLRRLEAEAVALREEKSDLQRRLAVEEQKSGRLADVERELAEAKQLADRLRDAKSATETESARVTEALSHRDSDLAELKTRLASTEAKKTEFETRLASLEATLEQERKQSAEKLALLSEARERMTSEFKILAAEVMQSHSETFSKQNKEQIEIVLTPLREKLGEFQLGLQGAQIETAKEREALVQQIRDLSAHSAKMTLETSNLTRALKGEAQTQGAWGEMILASILERSGLREGEEYVIQQSHTTEEGARLKPDVEVNLPGGQKIVIDSKVSLVAFDEYVNAESEAERAAHLKRHLTSIRTHIKTLSSKEYHSAAGSQLDYVVMFIPIEGALAAALQEDPGLTAEAVGANVAIATPTTLMIALRTVANVWQVERRNKNAEIIARRAGKIYDKLAGFLEDMTSLGTRIGQARISYDEAMAKLSSGRGNLVNQVEQLKQLGAKASKSLPASVLDENDTEPSPSPESPGALPEKLAASATG
jgi:DNA recombination protein RmuC